MHRDLIVDNMIYDSGTEGDCVWSVDINDRKWTVTVEKNGEIKTESFYGYEPRFGVDAECWVSGSCHSCPRSNGGFRVVYEPIVF